METFVHHENTLFCCDDVCSTSLEHGYLCAVLVEVLSNVVSAIPGTDDDYLLSSNVMLGCIIVLATVVHLPLEMGLSWEIWNLWFARMTGAPDEMAWMEGSLGPITSGYNHCPLRFCVIIYRRFDAGLEPNVQFHDASICFEPVAELIFRGKLGPVLWERKVRHVSEFRRIMGY